MLFTSSFLGGRGARNEMPMCANWEDFKAIDIYSHSAPYDYLQAINIPCAQEIRSIYIKIYPITENAVTLIAGFFEDVEGKPSETPFFELAVDTPKKIGGFDYIWSVDASVINISSFPRRGKMWLGFREDGKSYSNKESYSYNCQIVHRGEVKSHEKISGIGESVMVTGKSWYINYGGFGGGVIPYGYGVDITNRCTGADRDFP